MQDSMAGKLLVAAPSLLDPNFFRTVVLLVRHDEEGAFGLVLNRASEEPVEHHLPAWQVFVSEPPVVFVGGPVEPSIGIGLAVPADPALGEPVPLDGVRVVDLQATPEEVAGPVRVYAGYSGWGPGQLEGELEEGAWIVVEGVSADVFSEAPEQLWQAVLRRQGGPLAFLSTMPPDPSLN